MTAAWRPSLLGALFLLSVAAGPALAAATEVRAAAGQPGAAAALARVRTLEAEGRLRAFRLREDTQIPGRRHERLRQLHAGVPVFGGEIALQTEGGQPLTAFGTLYEGIETAVEPRVSAAAARARTEAEGLALLDGPELSVLPKDDGGYALAWRTRVMRADPDRFELRMRFDDALSGERILEYSDLQTQAAGSARGVFGDLKKISTRPTAGAFLADDRLRPPTILTYDMQGDLLRSLYVLNLLLPFEERDVARDADNDWNDGAAVDAHVYAGWVYDYLHSRFGRRGLDDANMPVLNVVHMVRREDVDRQSDAVRDVLYLNAAYLGGGLMIYGEGLPPGRTYSGLEVDYFSAGLDIVAHELGHALTDASSRLVYRNESGALNEAYSDILGASVEFAYQPAGSGLQRADYLLGEDVLRPGGARSMSRPSDFGDPDHYSLRYRGSLDNGGVHHNSGIANHAFYLAIEGGTHRLSGLRVQGVGADRRGEIERAFYRAFTAFLTPQSGFSQARAATIQAARELYGATSAAATAIAQAWTAVGVE